MVFGGALSSRATLLPAKAFLTLLYNKEGIPASPFCTDDWPLFDPDAEIVDVLKLEKSGTKATQDWLRPRMTQ